MIDINILYDNKIVNILLKNDCVIYGEFIRNFIIDNTLLKNNCDVIIHCYSKYLYKNILERDLHKYNLQVKSGRENMVYDLSVFSTERFQYILNYNGKKYILKICYFKKSIDNYNNSDLNILVDVDCLKLDRNLLGFIKLKELYNTEPIPLKKIFNNISNKIYTISINKEFLKKTEYLYLVSLANSNWKCSLNNTTNISDLNENNQTSLLNDKCSLCNNKHNKTTIKLICNHYYHRECLLNYISYYLDNSIHLNDIFKCPYCTKNIEFLDIL